MVSQEQVKEMALKCIQDYLNQYQPDTNQDAAMALMKLISTAGVVMFAAIGYEETIECLNCTTEALEEQLAGVKLPSNTAI